MALRAPSSRSSDGSTVSPVHVGPMRRRHLRSVLTIEQQVYTRPWTHGLFTSELSMRTARCYIVARVGSHVVGYSGLMFAPDEAHITTIAVDPSRHRQGLGTHLMLSQTRVARARGMTALTLEVRQSNTAAQEMYRRFGFAPVGVRRGYYRESGEDALVMWVHDIDSAGYERRLVDIAARLPSPTVLDPTLHAVVSHDAIGHD